jgi:hypothetical protein
MTEFIETLKKFYWQEKISLKRLKEMSNDGKITYDEFKYITAKEGSD